MLKQDNLDPKLSLFECSLTNKPAESDALLKNLMTVGYLADPFPNQVRQMVENKVQQSKKILLAECGNNNGLLTYRGKLYISDHPLLKLAIFQAHHVAPSAGQPGWEKSFELISRHYFWPRMREYIVQYIQNCLTSRRSKPTTHGKHGVLHPLPVPQQP